MSYILPEILDVGELLETGQTDELALPVVLQLVLCQALSGLGALPPPDLHLHLRLRLLPLLTGGVALLGVSQTGVGGFKLPAQLQFLLLSGLSRPPRLHSGQFSFPPVKSGLSVPPGLLEEVQQVLLQRLGLVRLSHQV